MIINTAGEYTLQYTATDACGNSTTVERDLVVLPPPRTVLYTDGTFIINERPQDIEANIQAHGQPTNVYEAMNETGSNYYFGAGSARPWNAQISSILQIMIGSRIRPVSTSWWFANASNCTSIDLTNLDTSLVTSMDQMFAYCSSLKSIDISGFRADSLTNTSYMFTWCDGLETIYSSDQFDTSQVTNSSQMFSYMSNKLKGGAGTTWSSAHKDKEYARIDNPPDAPGYFTAKS